MCCQHSPHPPIAHRKGRNPPPVSLWLGGRGTLRLKCSTADVSALLMLRCCCCCFNSHFLYKIDALTAAAAALCTHPHTGTVQMGFFSSTQDLMELSSSPLLSSSLLSPPHYFTTILSFLVL